MIDVDLARRVPGFTLDVAFRTDAGITALFGPSGAGKSMMLALIAGLMRPDRGHVRLADGAPLFDGARGIDLPIHKRRVGLVFQDAQLFPHLTIRQNLLFGRWFAPRAEQTVDLDTVVETLGISALMSRRPAGLSGGERQRVAIGRALLAAPKLLLFDEPLASLDRARKLEILPLIEALRDRFAVPIIYVSHAVDEVARLAASVIVLENGKVVAQDEPAAVLGPLRGSEEPRFGRCAVLNVTAGDIDTEFGLTALHHPAGTIWLAGGAPRESRVRALIKATDVSLAAGAVGPISIRSRLEGTIARVEPEGPLALVHVSLAGGGTVAALVTRRALFELGLVIGSPVTALVKSVALDEAMVAP